MSLRLKFDPHDHVVRSIGDPPNGIMVWISSEENPEPSFAVSPKWRPPTMLSIPESGEARVAAQLAQAEALTEDNCERLTPAEIAEGLVDHDTWIYVWQYSGGIFMHVCQQTIPSGNIPRVRAVLDWLEETVLALAEVHDDLLEAG